MTPGRAAAGLGWRGCALFAFAASALAPTPAEGQLSDPCSVGCGLVLGATSFVVAQGVATAVGRASGGFSTTRQGIVAWGAGFALAAGGGIALSGNGARQERAVHAAGIGTLAGATAGLGLGAIFAESSEGRLSAALVGGALGALVGGVVGAATWEPDAAGPGTPVELATVSLPLWF